MSRPKDPDSEPDKKPAKPRAWGTAPEPRIAPVNTSGWGKQSEPRTAPINTKGWGKMRTPHQAPRVSAAGWGTSSQPPLEGHPRPKWGIFIALCIAIAAGWGGWVKLAPLVKQRYWISHARESFAHKDWRGLEILLAQVMAINPDNLDACHLAAETLALRGDPQELQWRRKVALLAPENLDDQLSLADALLRFDKAAEADRILKSVEEKTSSLFRYQNLAGIAAERLGRGDLAEAHFARAAALDPQDSVVLVRLAIVRLQSPQPALRQQARETLEKFLAKASDPPSEPALKLAAFRGLILAALQENRADRALSLTNELLASPDSTLADRLLQLKILQITGSPDFAARLEETQEIAAKEPKNLAELLGWMNSNDLALFAAHWMHNLPLDFDLPGPVQFRMAESLARLANWDGLTPFVTSGDWGKADFLRRALLARCFDVTGDFTGAHTTWKTAIEATAGGTKELEMLVSIAAQWGWKNEAANTLWELSEKSDNPTHALVRIYNLYREEGDTEGLYRVLTKLQEHTPKDDDVRNDLALVSLLLNRDKPLAIDVSRELYLKKPGNPAYTSTYAFALYSNGKAPQGLQVMNTLTEQQREEPSVSAYYSILLTANAHPDEAETYLNFAKHARLLPEEERLLEAGDN